MARRALGLIVGVALLAFVVYFGYVAYAASARLVAPYVSTDCTSPMAEGYGWPFEAINYEHPAGDAGGCPAVGPRAGSAVVTADGTGIAGWFIPAAAPDPARPTLLLIHGHDANKSEMLPIAAVLHDRYDLVVVDLRASGYSGGSQQTLGVLEQQDVAAILDWLEETKPPAHIAAVGVSAGAGATLALMRTDARIEAIVADSMHARYATAIEQQIDNAVEFGIDQPAYPGTWAAQIGIALRTGLDLSEADPIDSLAYLGERPLLLLHGTADEDDVPVDSAEINLAEARRLGVDVELRYCAGAAHAAVIEACAADYGTWVSTFLDQAFAGQSDGSSVEVP